MAADVHTLLVPQALVIIQDRFITGSGLCGPLGSRLQPRAVNPASASGAAAQPALSGARLCSALHIKVASKTRNFASSRIRIAVEILSIKFFHPIVGLLCVGCCVN